MKPFCAGYIQMEFLVLQVFSRCEVITEWPDSLVSFHFLSCRYQEHLSLLLHVTRHGNVPRRRPLRAVEAPAQSQSRIPATDLPGRWLHYSSFTVLCDM